MTKDLALLVGDQPEVAVDHAASSTRSISNLKAAMAKVAA